MVWTLSKPMFYGHISAKAYKTQGGIDEFFHEVAKFLFEVACVSPRFYYMPKQ